jgi:glycosyltransferase involved in cell wall biosynthesis
VTYNQGDHPLSFHLDRRVHHSDLQVRTHAKYQYHGLRRLWEGWKRNLQLRRRLSEKLAETAPDVIVATTNGELSLLCRLKGRTPLVVESHGGYDHLIDYPNQSWVHRLDIRRRYRLLKKADAIVTLTESDARKWRTAYSQVHVIPNVVHLSPITQHPSANTRKRVIFVGRLAEQKGIPELMAVWRMTHRRHPDWQLEMYGEGDYDYVRQLAEGLQVFPPVTDIFDKYCGCSMLVLTSRWEPFGLVIVEAMSCGLPVVSFEGDGPGSIITDGVDGYIVGNRDIGVFADRVCQLMEDESLRRRMGEAAIQSAQRYTPDRIMPMWRQLFSMLNA